MPAPPSVEKTQAGIVVPDSLLELSGNHIFRELYIMACMAVEKVVLKIPFLFGRLVGC